MASIDRVNLSGIVSAPNMGGMPEDKSNGLDENNGLLMALIAFSKYFKDNDKNSGLYADLAKEEAIKQAIGNGLAGIHNILAAQAFLNDMKNQFGDIAGIKAWMDPILDKVNTEVNAYKAALKKYEDAKKKYDSAKKRAKAWETWSFAPKWLRFMKAVTKPFAEYFDPDNSLNNTKNSAEHNKSIDNDIKSKKSNFVNYIDLRLLFLEMDKGCEGINMGLVSGGAKIANNYLVYQGKKELTASDGLVTTQSELNNSFTTLGMQLNKEQVGLLSQDNYTEENLAQVLVDLLQVNK